MPDVRKEREEGVEGGKRKRGNDVAVRESWHELCCSCQSSEKGNGAERHSKICTEMKEAAEDLLVRVAEGAEYDKT